MIPVQSFWMNKLWLPIRRAYSLMTPVLPYNAYIIIRRAGNIVYRRKRRWRF